MATRAENALRFLTGAGDGVLAGDLPRTESAVQLYLNRIGVPGFFPAHELIRPRYPELARSLGFDDLIPPMALLHLWGLNLRLVGTPMRRLTGPVAIRHAWRPAAYNAAVGGARQSKHIIRGAIDYVFKSRAQRRKAEKLVLKPLWDSGIWDLGIGVGRKVIHVDLLRERNTRWGYSKTIELERFDPSIR